MRITIVAIGTRGDVQPFVALALGLQAAGHEVRLATEESLVNSFQQYPQITFAPIREHRDIAEVNRLVAQDRMRMMRQSLGATRLVVQQRMAVMQQRMVDCLRACQGSDAVVFSALAGFADSVAEQLGAASFPTHFGPVHPTRSFPSALLGTAGFRFHLGGAGNRMSHTLGRHLFWEIYRPPLNWARQEVLGLPPLPWRPYKEMDRRHHPALYAFSPSVLPKPADWGEWLHVTGYWFLDQPQAWQPPAALVDFLAAGPPPVYIGFGSMKHDTMQQKEQRAELMVKALAQVGQRTLLYTGENVLTGACMPDHVFRVGTVPFDWLFPRLAGVVHHGGSGTTGAGLRAGLPTAIAAFGADQPVWGWRIYDLGVGPRPISQKELSVEWLSYAIGVLATDERMHERAAALGARIRAEDGVGRAVAVIERYVAQHR